MLKKLIFSAEDINWIEETVKELLSIPSAQGEAETGAEAIAQAGGVGSNDQDQPVAATGHQVDDDDENKDVEQVGMSGLKLT